MSTNRFHTLPSGTKLYIGAIVIAGAATIAQSVYDLAANPISWNWIVLAVLTLVSGSATVRLPSLPATISVSETFVFTSVLLFGSSAGTLTVALDALVISFWSYKKGHPRYKIVFNVCALPLSIWLAGHAFFAYAPFGPLFHSPTSVILSDLIPPLLLFTVLYFALNSWIIAFAIALEKQLAPYGVWRNNFVWLSLNYFGGASVATLLVSYTKNVDFTHIAVIIPLLVVLYFTFSMSWGRVEDANRHLTELNKLYMSTIETLAMAIDAKDQITHGHIRRVQTLAVALAKHMGVNDAALIRAVEAAALLHDMGKLAVPEYILNKPGKLTPAEFDKMKLHASVGADILSSIEFPYPVVPIVRHHHENWDGTGYPDGLKGAEIPIGARILSVVDCFDALTSDRPYRPRLLERDAIRILNDRRGTMYDPLVVDTFVRVHTQIAPAQSVSEHNASLAAITEAAAGPQPTPAPVRRFNEISASTEEMLALFDLARSLADPMTLQDTGDLVAKHLRRLVPSSLCVFFLYDEGQDELVAAHAAGEGGALITGLRMTLGERLSGWVAAHKQSIRNSDAVLDLGEIARVMKPRPTSCISTPLLSEEGLVGVLTLYSTGKDTYSEEHQRVLEVVARQIAPIILRAAEKQKSRSSSMRDGVTGLPTAEHLFQLISTDGALQPHTSLVVVTLLYTRNGASSPERDSDVLLQASRASRRHLRTADLLFRSGDDLIAVLFQTDRNAAEGIAQRIHAAVVTEVVAIDPHRPVRVSVMTSPEDGNSIEELLSHAGRATHQLPGSSDTNQVRPPRSVH